jgi:hypothetical protein
MAIPQWPSILDALTLLLYVAMVALLVTIFSDSQVVLVPVALPERRDRRHRASY